MLPPSHVHRFFRDRTIRQKLMAIILFTCCTVLFAATLAFVVHEAISIRREVKRNLAIQADVIGVNVSSAIAFNDSRSATETLAGLRANPYILGAYIITSDSIIFASYVTKGGDPASLRLVKPGSNPPELDRQAFADILHEVDSFWEWDSDLEQVRKIVLDGQEIGTIVIFSETMEVLSRVVWLAVALLLISVVGFYLAYLLSSRLQSLISHPVQMLADAVKRVTAAKNYAVRAEVTGNGELGALATGFNEMLATIQARDEELQEINEEIRNFAYIVSHDLRAPLVSIKGFSSELASSIKDMQPLLNKCAAALDEKERKQLDLIMREDIGEALGFITSSVNRMDGLIGNILNLSRLGRKELKLEPLNMTEITRSILASLAHQIEEKKVTVTMAELPELIADRVAMEQIMGNLLDNALKYLEPGRDGELSITAEQKDNEVTFHVHDNGRGIAQDDMHKVFELFRRAGKQNTKGEGMGLAYVKALVRRHGGRIWCESQPGMGSTFSFTVSAPVNPSGCR